MYSKAKARISIYDILPLNQNMYFVGKLEKLSEWGFFYIIKFVYFWQNLSLIKKPVYGGDVIKICQSTMSINGVGEKWFNFKHSLIGCKKTKKMSIGPSNYNFIFC